MLSVSLCTSAKGLLARIQHLFLLVFVPEVTEGCVNLVICASPS